jgi:hypothetical protein
VLAAGCLTGALGLWSPTEAIAAADTVDEIHYSFGNDPGTVVFDWRGSETAFFYGTDTTYGSEATAAPSAITPVDIAGPFEEVSVSGLTPGATYHYRIGADGLDHTFQTAPTGSFSWVDIGDSMSSVCGAWMPAEQALIAAQAPTFVTHGGDIGVPNQCGTPSLHQYYLDQQVWSTGAAFQPVWGNHEYGPPIAGSPGTIRDSLDNYKGRSFLTNGQAVPNDIAKQTSNPGCGSASGSTVNTCQGEDWGWFQAGHVLFISYPEPWPGAEAAWQTKAGAVMASAQADPDIDFIVTYGHRPAYTSEPQAPDPGVQSATQALAKLYSPTAANPTGKYVLSVQHHVHGMEAFRPINGLTYITDAAGGQGLATFSATPNPNSVFRLLHFGLLSGHYDATAHSLTVSLVCGPAFNDKKGVCTYGTTLFTDTFTRPSVTPSDPELSVSHDDGVGTVVPGGQLTYATTVSDPAAGSTAVGVTLSVGVPAGATFVSADGGGSYDPATGTVTWSLGDVSAAAAAVTLHTTVTVPGTAAVGSHVMSTAQAATGDGSCAELASRCTATDDDAVASAGRSYIGNSSVETDLTGWAGRYGPSPLIQVSRDTVDGGHSGVASIKVAGLTGATGLNSGFSDKPFWVPSTTVGTVYTGSVWVRPGKVGQKIVLRLRDWNGSTLVADKFVTLTAATTGWQQITTSVTGTRAADHLTFIVQGNGIVAGQSFLADDMTLTSP